MNKQDRTHSRTPADTENKFLLNLGKRFSEVLGVATDARKAAENTEKQLQLSVAEITKELGNNKATIKLVVDSGLVDEDGNVQASIIIEAINNESTAKILADNIIFEGQKLNIKVESSNIEGKLTADQIDATNLKVGAANVTGKLTAEQIDADNLKVKAANIPNKPTAEQINADDMVLLKATIGKWHLEQANIPINASESIESEYALYSDEFTDTKTDRMYTYRVYLTARGVYVSGRYDTSNETGVPYYSHKTWLDICEGG